MFPVPPSVTMMLDEVVSTVAAVTATVGFVSPVVVVAADVAPDVEIPDVTAAETPGIIGMITEIPVVVAAAVVTAGVVCPPVVVVGVVGVIAAGGAEKMVAVVPAVGAPLSVPAVPTLGVLWAKLGNCQAKDMRGVRLRAKMRFLIFNMMIL